MQDIQLRRFDKDYLLIIRDHKADKGQPRTVEITILLPKTTETKNITVTLAPNKTVDHLREALQAELRKQAPRTFQDVEDLFAVIRSETPRLFTA